jgi:hypothetical protein
VGIALTAALALTGCASRDDAAGSDAGVVGDSGCREGDGCPDDRDAGHPEDRDAGVRETDASSPTWGTACDPRPGGDEKMDGLPRFLDVEIRASGFDAYEGATLRTVTYERLEAGVVTRVFGTREVIVTGGGFEVMWPNAYERFGYQPMVLYADVDDDGTCDPAVDPTWGMFSNAHNPPGDAPYVWDLDLGMAPFLDGISAADICTVANGC